MTTPLEDLKEWLKGKSSFDLFCKLDTKIDDLMAKERRTHKEAMLTGFLQTESHLSLDHMYQSLFPTHPTNIKNLCKTITNPMDQNGSSK
jgi:hypothetical protein